MSNDDDIPWPTHTEVDEISRRNVAEAVAEAEQERAELIDDDMAELSIAVAALKELREMDMSAFAPETLVAILKLAQETIDVAGSVRLDGLRGLGGCLEDLTPREMSRLDVSRRDESTARQMAEMPDDLYEQVKTGAMKPRRAQQLINRARIRAMYGTP